MRPRWQRRLLSLFAVYPHVDLDNSGGDRRLWRGPLDLFDAFALAFIAALFAVLVLRVHGLRPFISDAWYHLAVAKQVAAQGAIPAWVDWDYAPVGRPHLYPPLIHVILALLSKVTGGVVAAGQVLAVLFLPASYLTCWFCARWIFDSRAALVALLALSLDIGHAIIELIYIPSCLVNILGPILLITFLTRRTWASIALLTLLFYAHLGIPYLVAFGLILFGLKYPRYRGEALKVVGIALVWALPWLVRVWLNREWIAGVTHGMGLPMGLLKRLVSLQLFNAVLIGCGIWGLFRLRRWRAPEALVHWLLVGMLPLLFSYGGRYTMHSAPLFALSASTLLVRLLPPGATWKRATALLAATLLPTPALMPLTTTHVMFILAATGRPPMGGDKPKKSEAYEDDCDQLAVWLRSHTAPGEVIHVNKEWVGDMIPLLADRPTDFGAWWECSREIGKLENRRLRDDGRRAVFVCIKPESDVGSILGPTQVMPWVDEKLDLGRLRIGLRHERTYSLRAVLDDFEGGAQPAWRPAPAGGSALRVAEEPSSRPGLPPRRFLAWSVSSAKADRAEIARPFSPGGATGIALNVRASAPTGDVLLGVMTADGSRYQWELSLPCAGRDLWLRARVPLCGLTPAGKSPNADRRLDPAQITTLWLAGPKQPSPNLEIAVDDLDLMDVTVSKAAWHARPARGAVAEGGR